MKHLCSTFACYNMMNYGKVKARGKKMICVLIVLAGVKI